MKKLNLKIAIFLMMLFGFQSLMAQDTIKKKILPTKTNSVSKKAVELKEALSKDESDLQIAQRYEALAKQLSAKGDYAKAEEYLKKAKDIYAKLNKNKEVATVSRNIGKTQESQNKTSDAIVSYKDASEVALDKEFEKVNANDVERLRNSVPAKQDDYINSNISILEKQGKKEEVSEAYQQKAMNSIKLDDKIGAIENYKKALENVKGKTFRSCKNQE